MSVTTDPFIIALDIGGREALLQLAGALRGEVETVKVGLEAYANMGPEIIETLCGMGYRVFADLKLHDIPNTVRGAVRGLVHRGAGMITVHASGGKMMMEAAVEAAEEEARTTGAPQPLLLGVTVLTSLDEAGVVEIGWEGGAGKAVLSLARLAMGAGLDGVVASPREVSVLRRALGPEALIVTPGIRAAGVDVQDQARTATAREALAAGADYLVVGRPVIAQPDPAGALRELRWEAEGR